ncbi:hypothetical protein BC937DRAFT_87210 [Endogone sp. FLAS-F59071]|nr:hypothetical protein BC937DRAFT_87210 [Endogone sp. FLAS-F59071]|eukprot:RUS12714.1 hypothetical protein BC937DRAFT_87210 [Endogone sp. FLAS-F59071]
MFSQTTVQNLLLVLLILTACIAGEKLFLQIVAVRFHERTFRDRIVESSFAVVVISKLDQASKHRYPQSTRHGGASDLDSDDQHKLLRPATQILKKNLARLVEHTRNALEVTTHTIGHIASEIAGKDLRLGKDESFGMIQTASEARRLGRRVFKILCPPTRDHLLLEDFIPLFDDEVEAERAFWLFDKDGNGDISLDEFVSGCAHAFRERKAIMQSLRDLDQAIGKLDSILKTTIYFVILLIVIAIFLGDFTT